MYHSRVIRIPRSVEAIICSTVCSPPGVMKTMFMGASPISLGRGKPWPVTVTSPTLLAMGDFCILAAVLRAYTTFLITPFSQVDRLPGHAFTIERHVRLQRMVHVIDDGDVFSEKLRAD